MNNSYTPIEHDSEDGPTDNTHLHKLDFLQSGPIICNMTTNHSQDTIGTKRQQNRQQSTSQEVNKQPNQNKEKINIWQFKCNCETKLRTLA